jgi:hypothetical protein
MAFVAPKGVCRKTSNGKSVYYECKDGQWGFCTPPLTSEHGRPVTDPSSCIPEYGRLFPTKEGVEEFIDKFFSTHR